MPSERIQRQIDRLLDEADEAVRQLDWSTVRDRAEAALALDGENADARSYLASAQSKLGTGSAQSTDTPSGSRIPVGSPAPTPESFCNGRYVVKKFLGEGGKKRVYLATDTLLDRDVAFALIKTDGLDEVGRERVRREAQAMGRLGAHPHVVSVFDLGEEDGQPFIVTELMGGGDVEGLIEQADSHRVPLDIAIRIADEVCQGLEFAHGKQVVHRDLKPGNVWLTADGTAKLGDFGLAVSLDRTRLTQAGMMVGTVSYMPPEQATGGEVTPRSDLYSLGAMLYELVTGRPPFVGDEAVAIITQHLNTPPVSPSWHVPGLPAGLETLILRLLEKDPSKRPASAEVVRGALASIGLDGKAAAGESAETDAEAPGENPLYRRTFVGREPELRQLQHAFDAALSGQGSLIAVVGEPGIGKTALCEQIATYVAVRGGKTLVGHAYEEGSFALPYLPFVEALRSYVLARDPEGLRQDLGSGAAEVARIVSEVRDRVSVELHASVDADDDRWRLYQAIGSFVRNASTVQPLLIVLEDLHWADRGTLDLLVHLARQLQGARLLIVANYRDVEVDRAHPLSDALAELRRVQSFARIPLRGLTTDEVQRMMSTIAGQSVTWSLAEAVHRQTEGNPLFVQEVLRYLAEEGLVHREDGSWQRTSSVPIELQIPEGLRDVIGKRLSRLSPECNRLLTIAAVIGRDFRLDTLQTVAAVDDDAVLAPLEEALRVGVLEDQSRPGQVRYRFAHAFFRQTLYEELITPRRLRLHQQVARTLEAQYASRLDEHAAELAEHFAQSSDPAELAKAVRYARLAASKAMSVYAYGEAIRLLRGAVQVQELAEHDDATACDLLLELGEAMIPGGEALAAAEEVAPQALALAERMADRGRCFRACRLGATSMSRYGFNVIQSHPAYQRWAELAATYATPRTAEQALADIGLGSARLSVGRRADAFGLFRRAMDLARELGDTPLLFEAAVRVITSSGTLDEEAARRALLEELLVLPRDGVAPWILGNFLYFGGELQVSWGDREGAESLWAELEPLSRRTNDPQVSLRARQMAITRSVLDGDFLGAIQAAETLPARAEEMGIGLAGKQVACQALTGSLIHLGRATEALEKLRELRSLTRNPLALPLLVPMTMLCLAHLNRGDEASALLAEGYRDEAGNPAQLDLGVIPLLYLLEAFVVLGDAAEAEKLAARLESLSGFTCVRFAASSVARQLGAAAALRGDRASARRSYEQALEVANRIQFRPEVALTRLQLAELLLDGTMEERADASRHLDFAIEELRAMKMQPSLERALRHKGLLHA